MKNWFKEVGIVAGVFVGIGVFLMGVIHIPVWTGALAALVVIGMAAAITKKDGLGGPTWPPPRPSRKG